MGWDSKGRELFCFILLLVFLFVLVFGDRVSLCSPGCPGTHSVDQAGLKLRNLPVSASQVLGLKACTTTARLDIFSLKVIFYQLFLLKSWVDLWFFQLGKRI